VGLWASLSSLVPLHQQSVSCPWSSQETSIGLEATQMIGLITLRLPQMPIMKAHTLNNPHINNMTRGALSEERTLL
jgi:hypothetical protein